MKRVTFVLVLSLAISSTIGQWSSDWQWNLPELWDDQDEQVQTEPEIPTAKPDQLDVSDFLQKKLSKSQWNLPEHSDDQDEHLETEPEIPTATPDQLDVSDFLQKWSSDWHSNLPELSDDQDKHLQTEPEIPTAKPDQLDVSDFLQNHLKTVRQHVRPFWLGHPFAMAPVGEDLLPVGAGQVGCHDCDPWQSVFGKIFGNAFKKHLIPINTTVFEQLPPNYKNSTSDTHNIDGSKVVVNQTIHKKSGDDFHHFFHHKVIHVRPHVETEDEEEIEKVTPESPDVPQRSPEEASFGIDTAENEVNTDSLGPYETKSKLKPLLKRSVADVLKKNGEISFPSPHVNKFPHSMANTKFLKPLNPGDDGKVSRSWVYKDMGGKSYLYKLSHKKDPRVVDSRPETPAVSTNRDAETVGPIRPPDLARDTRVNPDGSESQQGLSLVEPEAEVFNLTLVIKEAESRANTD